MSKEELKEIFPRSESSGSSTRPAYSVEVRFNYKEPKMIGDKIYHKEWKTLRFEKSKIGVPDGLYQEKARDLGLLSYEAAQALRWWFHASLGYEGACFESRILKHIVKDSYTEEVVGAFDTIGGDDRSSVMPDFKGKT